MDAESAARNIVDLPKECGTKRVLSAPEGGWGYAVSVGMAVMLLVTAGPINSSGMVLHSYFEDLDISPSGINYISSVNTVCTSIGVFMVNIALKRFTVRQIGLFGAFVFSLGNLITVFTTDIVQIIFTQGVLQGFGFGLMINVSYTSINSYFVERRASVLAVTQSIVSFGLILYPIMIKYFLELYNYRGTLALLGAISFNSIVAMATLQPVAWHMIFKERDANYTEKDAEISPHGEFILPMPKTKKPKKTFDINETPEENVALKGETYELTSFSDAQDETVQNRSKWKHILDVSLLKELQYMLIVFGLSFDTLTDTTFFVLEPGYLIYENGFDQSQVATCLMLNAIGELLSKLSLSVYCHFIRVNAIKVILAGAWLIMISRLIFLQYKNYIFIAILTTVVSFLRCWNVVLTPVVFVDNYAKDRFPSVYGLYYLMSGAITLSTGYFIGLLHRMTGSFLVVQYTINLLCFLFCVLPWSIEWVFCKNCKTSFRTKSG